MVGYIELIKREELSDIVRDYVDVISERAEKLKEMINSLFNLAKASSRKCRAASGAVRGKSDDRQILRIWMTG